MRNWKTVSTAIIVGLLTIWLAIVLFTSTRHEFWRDEVRALSIARAAHSPLDIFRIRNEGHPALWYLLLYLCKSIVDSPLVLPVLSITIAFAAVVLFLFRAPFPLWLRALFIFSALPLYEYSVMARNYGISMLLFFIAAALYRERDEHPLWLAFVLALLANTNIHSAMLVGLVAIVWMWDFVARKKAGAIQLSVLSLCFGLAIIVAGLALCLVVALPTKDTIVTRAYSVTAKQVFAALLDTVWRPQIGVLLYLLIFCLVRRVDLFLAGLGGLIGFGVFPRGLSGSYRHQGIFLVFVLFLYWLTAESPAETTLPTKYAAGSTSDSDRSLRRVAGVAARKRLQRQSHYRRHQREMSSSQAFGAFLNQSNAYRNAIIVAEPAFSCRVVTVLRDQRDLSATRASLRELGGVRRESGSRSFARAGVVDRPRSANATKPAGVDRTRQVADKEAQGRLSNDIVRPLEILMDDERTRRSRSHADPGRRLQQGAHS
jgi:hypothetical protein